MSAKIQVRRDTSVNWSNVNPILLRGEIAFEIDTKKVKIGDGFLAWNTLPYALVSETMVQELVDAHANLINNPHNVTKSQVGLDNVDNTSDYDKPISNATQLALNNKADLDGAGKVPASQLPNAVMEYKGGYNPVTNTPTLIDGTGNAGDVYRISAAGSRDFGSGSISFELGDFIIYSGFVWERSPLADGVVSVNGYKGAVILTKTDINLENVPNVDATLRANHTGTQVSATISDFNQTVQSIIQPELNSKQPIGNYITSLTGDVIATGPGDITATLSTTGVVAGTYDKITVDVKGRVISGSAVESHYASLNQTTNNTITYSAINGLTTDLLPIGIYRFSFNGQYQSASAQTGIGLRMSTGTATVTTCYGKWNISQGVDGTSKTYQYDQLTSTTNITSASTNVINTNANIDGYGIFRVTNAGTMQIQVRSETAGTQILIQPDAVLSIIKVG